VAKDAVQGSGLSGGGDNGNGADEAVAALAAAARGDGKFLGRHDVAVAEDGSITFSLDPEDEGVQQLAKEILERLSC